MNTKTYYETLGLANTCTAQEIKRSYRQLALIWHPDKHTNKEEAKLQFMFINEAYHVLNDINQRRIYDVSGKEGLLKSKDDIQKNPFFQKGFQSSDKSPFDILKNIIEEKMDNEFLRSCEASGYSKSVRSSLKSFVHETVISSDEDTANFLADYQPTFLNSKFAKQSEFLDQFLLNKQNTPTKIVNNPFSISRNRPRKNSFLAPEESENKNFPFKVLKTTKIKSRDGLLRTLKNQKRPFLIRDEDDEQPEDDEFLMGFVQPRFLKKKSYRSEAVEESDYICHTLASLPSKKLKTETII